MYLGPVTYMNTAPSNWGRTIQTAEAIKKDNQCKHNKFRTGKHKIGSRCISCSPYISDKARIDKGITHQTSGKNPDMKDVMEWNSVCIIIPKLLGMNFTCSFI